MNIFDLRQQLIGDYSSSVGQTKRLRVFICLWRRLSRPNLICLIPNVGAMIDPVACCAMRCAWAFALARDHSVLLRVLR